MWNCCLKFSQKYVNIFIIKVNIEVICFILKIFNIEINCYIGIVLKFNFLTICLKILIKQCNKTKVVFSFYS